MARNFLALLKFGIVAAFLLNACGTRDYASVKSDEDKKETNVPDVLPVIEEQTMVKQASTAGYLWEGLSWVGLPNEMFSDYQCKLEDGTGTNNFNILGTTVIGGAILGLVVRVSGSWFFGGPVDSEASHRLWRYIDQTKKYTSQGIVRGGLFSGACYLLLTGANPISFNGLLGPEFGALSSSLTLGGMGSLAAHPFVRRLIDKDWSDPSSKLGKIINQREKVRRAGEKFEDWSNTTKIGKTARYKVIPGISIVGIGSGIGLVVYNLLQDQSTDENGNEENCLKEQQN